MKKIFLFLIFITASKVLSQKTTEMIASSKLNEEREITIGLPLYYDKNPEKKYPLLILLDGDYLFDPFQGPLNYGAYWDDLPEVIIVGISQNKNNERELDCTTDEANGLPIDKGEKFYEFIGLELIPYIQKKYRTTSFRIIAGHDVTAGFLNSYLYKDQPLFNAYISLSPELKSGMVEQIPERLAFIEQQIFYYQSTSDGDIKKEQKKIRDLDQLAKAIKKPNLNYKFDDFKESNHYSLVLKSIPNALYQIFDAYKPISSSEFLDKIVVLQLGYVDYLSNKYDALEKTLNIKMPVRINDFKAIEAAILKNKAYAEFQTLAELAKKNYPKTMLSDYHLAMMYEKTDDYKKAAKAYLSAFQKDEIGSLTKNMMFDKSEELKSLIPSKDAKVIEQTEPIIEQPTEEKKIE